MLHVVTFVSFHILFVSLLLLSLSWLFAPRAVKDDYAGSSLNESQQHTLPKQPHRPR